MKDVVIVFGGDGFCGWPTSLRLADSGYKVVIVDNLSRRRIDTDLGSESLTQLASIEDRVAVASKLFGEIIYRNIDIASEPDRILSLLQEFTPRAVIQFAEQRAAPYSMIGSAERRYTVNNNISGTHNICDAIVASGQDIHLVHLGTMGVYGYSKEFGSIPEGSLDITINSTKQPTSILYPANPGSVYHMTKCLDQLIFQFYAKNWGLRVTDLHQGIVWGVETPETLRHEKLVNRFDYDGIYGTVLNRFISQAVNGEKLTVYGTGGQTRAFIHITDTAQCLKLAIDNDDFSSSKPRIFNQVAETASVRELAEMISRKTGVDIAFLDNPRKELAENELEVSNQGLVNLGFSPTYLDQGLIEDIMVVAESTTGRFNSANVNTSPKW